MSRSRHALVLVAAGVGLAALANSAFATVLHPVLRIAFYAAFGMVGGIGLIRAARRPTYPWVIVAGTALIGATVLSGLTSRVPSALGAALLQSAALVGIAELAMRWSSTPRGRQDAAVVAGVGLTALIAGTFLATVVGAWNEWLSLGMPLPAVPLRPGGVGGIVPGPIWTSDYLALLGPIGVGLLWSTGSRPGRVAAALLALLVLAGLGVGAVRALWVSCGLVAVVLGVFAARRSSSRVPLLVALGLCGFVALAASALVATGRIDYLLRSVDAGRSTAMRAALEAFAGAPILGRGPGSFGTFRMGLPAEATSHLALPDAHNLLVHVAAELGVAGLAAMAVTGVLVFRAVQARGAGFDVVAVGAISGLAATGLHRMADMVYFIPGIAVVALVSAGIALGPGAGAPPARAERPTLVRLARLGAGACLIVLVVSVPMAAVRMQAEAAYREGLIMLAAGDAPGAETQARDALALAPDFAPAEALLALAADASGDGKGAVEAAERAEMMEPSSGAVLRTAVLLARYGRAPEAMRRFSNLIQYRPPDATALLTAAVYLWREGDTEAAADAIDSLLTLRPDSPAHFGSLPQGLTAMAVDRVRPMTEAFTAAGRWDDAMMMALAAGNSDLAAGIVRDMPTGLAATRSLVVGAARGDASAWERLAAAAELDPEALDRLTWWTAARTCRDDEAERWWNVVRIRIGTAPVSVVGIGEFPGIAARTAPDRYPEWIWGVPDPQPSAPTGTWAAALGLPACTGD